MIYLTLNMRVTVGNPDLMLNWVCQFDSSEAELDRKVVHRLTCDRLNDEVAGFAARA